MQVSVGPDRGTQRRFGWLYPEDVSVLSAVAMPIGESIPDDPVHWWLLCCLVVWLYCCWYLCVMQDPFMRPQGFFVVL